MACLELLCSISAASEFPTQYDKATLGTFIHDIEQGGVSCTTEVPAALKCTGKFTGHHLSIEFRSLNLCNFKPWIINIEIIMKTTLQFVDDLSLPADDHAHALCGKGHLRTIRGSLEMKATEAGSLSLGQEELANQHALDVAVDEFSNGTVL